MTEPLDLTELATACNAAGLTAWSTCRGFILAIPGKRKRCRWRGTNQEHGWLLVILRDAVRSILPGSYCAPTLVEPDAEGDSPLCVIPRDAQMAFPQGMPMLVYGRTETECWARALVALFRAGLVPGIADEHWSESHHHGKPDHHEGEEPKEAQPEAPGGDLASHGGQDTGGEG